MPISPTARAAIENLWSYSLPFSFLAYLEKLSPPNLDISPAARGARARLSLQLEKQRRTKRIDHQRQSQAQKELEWPKLRSCRWITCVEKDRAKPNPESIATEQNQRGGGGGRRREGLGREGEGRRSSEVFRIYIRKWRGGPRAAFPSNFDFGFDIFYAL